MIGILDYEAGNLGSVNYAFKRIKAKSKTVKTTAEIRKCDALVIPGVGAFKTGMKGLRPVKTAVVEFVKTGKPVLGICLGMQLLFEKGTENGSTAGLAILKGSVEKMKAPKLPHVGWNQVKQKKKSRLFAGIANNSYFYFVHSYACVPKEPECVVGATKFYVEFASAVEQGNVFGVQFHPEKSGKIGEKMLKNFWRIVKNVRNTCN